MHIEFYFDFSCPFAYVASTQIEALAADRGAELGWRPMLLGGVFRDTGAGDSPMTRMNPAKARNNARDYVRAASYLGVPLAVPARHPMSTLRALRTLLALPEAAWPGVIHGVYRAYWQDGLDIEQANTLRSVLATAGIADDVAERAVLAADDPAIKAELRRRTDEAVARGVFGAPTMFVHGLAGPEPLMFWGQDRLPMVRAALDGRVPGPDGARPAGEPAAYANRFAGERAAPRVARPRLEFWYDFSSPFAYLGSARVEAVASAAGAELVWRPMLLGAVFKQLGTDDVPLFSMPPAKRAYIRADMERWASLYDVPLRFPSKFPQRTVTALRLALLAGDRVAELSHALFRVLWAEGGDLEDGDTLARVLGERGFDAAELLASTQDPETKQALIANTTEAVKRNIFGAPTCVVSGAGAGDELVFWGQDRLDQVAAALRGWRPDPPNR